MKSNIQKTTALVFCTFAILMVATPQVNAFSLFGFDFGSIWDKISFWSNDDKKEEPKEEKPKTTTSSNKPKQTSSSNSQPKQKTEASITLAGKTYTNSGLKSSLSSEEMKGYIKGFNYDCVFIETDKGTKFTLHFNTEEGTLKEMKKGNSCEDKEIYLEESLLEDIAKDGFKAGDVKSYLERVELPWSMYGKALKVFTVG